MLIDPHWNERALEAHLSLPTGDVVRLPASRDEDDAALAPTETNRLAALRSHHRMAQHARMLGMSQREFARAKKAGLLPAWAMRRAPRSDRKERS